MLLDHNSPNMKVNARKKQKNEYRGKNICHMKLPEYCMNEILSFINLI